MKIKTITCHDVYNYGASLQAYALQTFLENNGHEVEIIDYLPKYKRRLRFFKARSTGFLGKIYRFIPWIEPLCAAIQHRRWYILIPKIIRFNRFKEKKLHCTKKIYYSFEELKKCKPEADLYIAGSDQIWNTEFQNGLDPAFYCMFETKRHKCISYAASFGISQIQEKHQGFVKKGLSNFRTISIREKTGVNIAQSLGYYAENVLDPVFLLSKEHWKKMLKHRHEQNYLLIYDFSKKDERIKDIALMLAKERNLKIYSFNSDADYIEKKLSSCGPIEFLEWISDADIILSNSFHATAFAVIFERDFYTISLKDYENSSRMKDFLSLVGLDERFVSGYEFVKPYKKVDYSNCSMRLDSEIEKSQQWLLNNLFSTCN